jgi:NADPH-dependent curcumin reductase CurA
MVEVVELKNTRIILQTRPSGMTVDSTMFSTIEETISPSNLKESEVLVKNLHLDFSPSLITRLQGTGSAYMPAIAVGACVDTHGICEVVESKSEKYRSGDIVFSFSGWETYSIVKESMIHFPIKKDAPSYTQYLSLFGICSITAWIGLNCIAHAKEGETILVSAAAGATGHAVC